MLGLGKISLMKEELSRVLEKVKWFACEICTLLLILFVLLLIFSSVQFSCSVVSDSL